MPVVILQMFLVCGAGIGLYLLWRRYVATARFGSVVTIGFLLRAFTAQVLFWISYLELPFARSLQAGEGLWFFAIDARTYLYYAYTAADDGFMAILLHSRYVASVTFVQIVALFAFLFGSVASVGVLLNLFAYLGACSIIIRWSSAAETERRGIAAVARLVALLTVSLTPSVILWSLQPLKDTFFQFIVIAFIGAAVVWQRAWGTRTRWSLVIVAAAVMGLALFAATGIRWYFGFMLLVATGLFLLLMPFWLPRRRLMYIAVAVCFAILLTQAFRLGGGPYIPEHLQSALHFKTFATELRRVPRMLTADVEKARSAFESAGGATTIRVATRPDPKPVEAPPPMAAVASPAPAPQARTTKVASARPVKTTEDLEAEKPPPAEQSTPRESNRTVEPELVAGVVALPAPAEKRPEPVEVAETPAVARSVASAPAAPRATTAAPIATTTAVLPATKSVTAALPVGTRIAATPTTTVSMTTAASKQPATTTANPTTVVLTGTTPESPTVSPTTVATTPATTTAASSASAAAATPTPRKRQLRSARREAATKATPQLTETATIATPVTPVLAEVVPPPPAPVNGAPAVAPTTPAGRLTAGAVALLLPQSIAQRIGLVDVGGGRGLMWFADVDTLVFDALLLVAVLVFFRGPKREAVRNPLFWLVVATTIMVAVPLVYTISNFGTLFRLRAMIFTGLALIPLAVAMSRRDAEPTVEVETPHADA